MKGASYVKMPEQLQNFVTALDLLAKQQFPIQGIFDCFNAHALTATDFDPYMFFSHKKYMRNLIHKSFAYELILMCWAPGQSSPIHGHEGEKCFLRVEKGELEFVNYREEMHGKEVFVKELNRAIGKPGFVDGPAIIHKVSNLGNIEAASLHLYARPFAQCDVFDESAHVKSRVNLGYDSEQGKLLYF